MNKDLVKRCVVYDFKEIYLFKLKMSFECESGIFGGRNIHTKVMWVMYMKDLIKLVKNLFKVRHALLF